MLSGMQPSGRMHLGNLLGALDNWIKYQQEYDAYFFVADWHALSTNYADTSRIREYIHEMLLDWLSAGVDPEKCTLFIQSRVPEHAVLHLLLSMITPVPWLERNPTYKEKMEELRERDLTTYGFLGYPVLQSADILIYKAEVVPVGVDQLPHLELTRELARRFNNLYTAVFPEPQPLLTEVPKLLGTDGKKMSKSYNNAIYLSDSEKDVREKLRTMVTDPARVRRTDRGNPDICPVFSYHKIFSEIGVIDRVNTECRTAAIGCIDCKKLVADRMVGRLEPIWETRAEWVKHPKKVEAVVAEGSEMAGKVARTTLAEAKEAMKI
ncbi:MAG: tryptophan--tRNA ligase [Nitrospirae bacterium]|nr:tryptophan--tRNA ligase [Nitrospirota bacterium]